MNIYLRNVDGSRFGPLETGREYIVGRSADCDWQIDDGSVSRRHARFHFRNGAWHVEDLGSRHGLILSGRAVAPGASVAIRLGDRISLAGTALVVEGPRSASGLLATVGSEDAGDRSFRVEVLSIDRQLQLLLDATARLLSVPDEETLFRELVTIVMATGAFDRALVVDAAESGAIGVRAAAPPNAAALRPISNTLVREARLRGAVRLTSDGTFDQAHSIISGSVTKAVAAPVHASGQADIVLLADATARGTADQFELVAAASRMASLARQALRAAAAEQERAVLREELSAARSVQERFLPPREGRAGAFEWRLTTRPGRVVAGDMAMMSVSGERTTWLIGDVAGKGAGPGLVMAALQAHFTALLAAGVDVRDAAARTNEFFVERKTPHATAAVVAITGTSLECINVAHSYLLRHSISGDIEWLGCEGGPPFGSWPGLEYESTLVELCPGDSLIVITDGLVEQPLPDGSLLGMDRVVERLRTDPTADPLSVLEAMLAECIGNDSPADDVTMLQLRRV